MIYNDTLLVKYQVQLYDHQHGGPAPSVPSSKWSNFKIDTNIELDEILIQFAKKYRMVAIEKIIKFCEERMEREELLD